MLWRERNHDRYHWFDNAGSLHTVRTKIAFAPEDPRTDGPGELSQGIVPPLVSRTVRADFRGTRLLS